MLFAIKEIDNEPHGIMYISSVLKAAGHEVKLVVATERDPVAFALEFQPQLVGYSVFTGMQQYYLDLNRRIKAQVQAFSAFGGPHPTFYPEIVEEEGVDGVCVGEGEYATLDLVTALEKGQPIAGIPNWRVKVDGQIHQSGVRPLVENLESLPMADREFLYEAHRGSRETKIKPFLTGRGCPFNCSFCFNHAYGELYRGKGRRVRQRSVDHVIAELRKVREEYPLEFITFMDDTFILSRRWLAEFADEYRQEIGLPFWCQVRADLIDKQMVETLSSAGCVSVSMGVEAGNDYLRNAILHRNMSKEQITGASRIIREAGIKLSTNNMLGLPGGSLEADMETLMLNIACKPAYANVFLLQPYPRTELGELVQKKGLMEGSFDEITPSVASTSVIRFEDKKEKRAIENLQKLFAITVEFPFLLPLVKTLIRLPGNQVFWLVYKLWKGYTLKRRLLPHRLSLGEYVGTIRRFMQIKAQ